MTTVPGERNIEIPFEKDSEGGIFKRESGSETHTDMLYLAFFNVNCDSPTLKERVTTQAFRTMWNWHTSALKRKRDKGKRDPSAVAQ